jgi:hypothetical protein
MKLNLLFIVMDLLTLLAYPFIFMHAKLSQFSEASNVSVIGPVTPGDELSETIDTRKKGDHAYSKD